MRSATKTERQIKADQVLDMILKYIRDNDLKPGDRIPSERALSELFGVGRPVIREAVRVLSMMNVIEIRQQGGMFVTQLDGQSDLDFFQLYMKSGQISLTEVTEARLILEVACVALAATHITEEELDKIERLLRDVSIDDAEGFAEADRDLHRAIYASTGNRALQLLMQTVSMWTVVSRNFSNAFREVREIVHMDHLRICAALRARDVERSRECMRQHILHIDHIQTISDSIVKAELSKMLDTARVDAL